MPAILKHRWSVGKNFLAGITTGDWFKLLRENRFAVDPAYWHRAGFVTLVSGMNSLARRKEERLFHDRVASATIQPPLFILGHWRSGTTHLHNLLARDTRQFAFANTYQVVNPHTFLCTEETNTRRFAWMAPKTRPMDDMELSFQVPQEDEFAPCLMSLRSLYLGISFPRSEDEYSRYLTFDGVAAEEIAQWKSAFTWFLKKLSFKYQRPLVLKSPPHTARLKLLLEMFPGARFVHIHRHPYQVFRSCRHYYDTAVWFSYLQRLDLAGIDGRIIRRYTKLHEAFFAERDLIPAGHFHELSFDDLERDPVGAMQTLYQTLGLPADLDHRAKGDRRRHHRWIHIARRIGGGDFALCAASPPGILGEAGGVRSLAVRVPAPGGLHSLRRGSPVLHRQRVCHARSATGDGHGHASVPATAGARPSGRAAAAHHPALQARHDDDLAREAGFLRFTMEHRILLSLNPDHANASSTRDDDSNIGFGERRRRPGP